MERPHRPPLATWLAAPERVTDLNAFSQAWRDLDCQVILHPVGPADSSFGAHLRRSFLAALAPGASPQARAGLPCLWEPPCALDVFLREQLRHKGDGLPKPYVLFWQQQGQVMQVTLRLFGTACDWGPAAFEALTAAMAALPWSKALHCVPPRLIQRQIAPAPWTDLPDGPLTLQLVTPLDDEGSANRDRDIAARLLSRGLRRLDALARWQGLSLEDDTLRALTAQAHAVRASATRLQRITYISPNNRNQNRQTRVLVGEMELPALPPELRLALALMTRSHIGRHTNEGLGLISVAKPGVR